MANKVDQENSEGISADAGAAFKALADQVPAGVPVNPAAVVPPAHVPPAPPQAPTEVSIRSLMDAGAHFGHQTYRWNPKMTPYIFGERNGVHIINLDYTMRLWKRAREYVVSTLSRGGSILFVGTKLQAREIVEFEAKRCGALYTTSRWLGGTLSNFATIKNAFERMRRIEELLAKAEVADSGVKLKKKEKLGFTRELSKLNAGLGGIRNMKKVPDLIFVVDIQKEAIAVSEAHRLRIPIMAMVDTNVDPALIDFPVPSNDDAARTIKLFVAAVADAVIEGRAEFSARRNKGDGNKGDDSERGNGGGSGGSGTEVSSRSRRGGNKNSGVNSSVATPAAPAVSV